MLDTQSQGSMADVAINISTQNLVKRCGLSTMAKAQRRNTTLRRDRNNEKTWEQQGKVMRRAAREQTGQGLTLSTGMSPLHRKSAQQYPQQN